MPAENYGCIETIKWKYCMYIWLNLLKGLIVNLINQIYLVSISIFGDGDGCSSVNVRLDMYQLFWEACANLIGGHQFTMIKLL